MRFCLLFAILFCVSISAVADEQLSYNACVIDAVENSIGTKTVSEIRHQCLTDAEQNFITDTVIDEPLIDAEEFEVTDPYSTDDADILANRRLEEQLAINSRRALVPHQRNYLLPASYSVDPNEKPIPNAFSAFFPDEDLDNVEVKFQLSLKYQFAKSVLMRNDSFHVGFTSLSLWQAYNSDVSAPFRETNYEPEIFWTAPVDFRPLGIDASEISVGFSHQSNGQSGTLSRSWNRVYANFIWETGNYVFGFKPWYRIREDDKDSILDAEGDDNPDIENFLGHFEFTSTYRTDNHEVSLLMRNNLRSDSRGAVQLDWTFPIWRGLKGHAQYFNGYGESLIDYNKRVERIGFGLLLSDLY